jgi:S1-C subfamily serine protease
MNELSLLTFSNCMADAIDAIAPSIVQVQGRRRPASGVVFADSLVLTTTRALGREDGLRVRTPDGRTLDADLAGWDPATGLVVLKAATLDAPAASPAGTPPRVGHLAIAVGRSWSNALTATTGIVSVIGGPLPTGHGRTIDRVIRTSAPMHGGFAGGALLDAAGQVIGIATAMDIRGLGVVIPSEIAWATAQTLAEHGTVQRGYLGVAGQAVTLPERQRQSDGRSTALLIVEVSAGSPADAGGILVGDVMISFDGQPIGSPLDLLDLLQGDRVGREMRVRLLRGGAVHELSVVVGRRPSR